MWALMGNEVGRLGDTDRRMENGQMGQQEATGKFLQAQRYTCNLGVVPCDPALPSHMSQWGKMDERAQQVSPKECE